MESSFLTLPFRCYCSYCNDIEIFPGDIRVLILDVNDDDDDDGAKEEDDGMMMMMTV